MKKNFVFAAVLTVFALVVGASAQETKRSADAKNADFSGTWTLDAAKSELGQAAGMIKSQTLTITQSGASFKVATATERVPAPEGAARAAGPGGAGGGGGRAMAAGPQEQSYNLDGKETSVERQTPNGAVSVKTRAEQHGSKIRIATTSPGPDGEVTMVTAYELSADGKTLTVIRPGRGGAAPAKWVYTKS